MKNSKNKKDKIHKHNFHPVDFFGSDRFLQCGCGQYKTKEGSTTNYNIKTQVRFCHPNQEEQL